MKTHTFLFLLALGLVGAPASARADDETLRLIDDLGDATKADAAVDGLIKKGKPVVKHLLGEALEGKDLTKRGWSIVALAEIGGDEVKTELKRLYDDRRQPKLVRTWAAAARVRLARGVSELSQLVGLVNQFPPLGRPLAMRLVALSGNDPNAINTMLMLSSRHPQLNQALGKAIASKGTDALLKAMLTAPNNAVRRQAAGFLGGMQGSDPKLTEKVAKAVAFDADAKGPPWDGAALFVPGIQWDKENARLLVDNLIRWMIWAERHNRADIKQQISNNIRSVGLSRVVGYGGVWQPDTIAWLRSWRAIVGKAGLEAMFAEQGVGEDPKFLEALTGGPHDRRPRRPTRRPRRVR